MNFNGDIISLYGIEFYISMMTSHDCILQRIDNQYVMN